MVQTSQSRITLEDFLSSPESGDRCELINGEVIPKVAPKRFHSKVQRALLRSLEAWGEDKGEIGVEWAVVLTRQGQTWVPVPDVSFVYFQRLPDDLGDEACPIPFDLAIEIIFPNQTFGTMAEKATDYILAGVEQVWIVDSEARTITVFKADSLPITYRSDRKAFPEENRPIADEAFPGFSLTPHQLFQRAGIASAT